MEESYKLVVDKLEAFTASDFKDHDVERFRLLVAARKLISRLETPQERMISIAYHETMVFAVLKTCIDIGLWDKWTAAGGGEKSLDELVKLTTKDCDINLLRRLLRLMGAENIIEETGEDRYKPTPFSLSIGDESTLISQALLSRTYHWDPCNINLPLFLAKTSYREPKDPKYTSYSDGTPEGLPFFDRNLSKPIYQETWSALMREWGGFRVPWPKFYDTDTLVNGADPSSGAPLIVDIGGHHGVDLNLFLDKHPDVPAGSLVIQDLEGVVSTVKLATDKIKLMAHSFFDEQPIHGSRAYFFHGIFHDWPDAEAIKILKNIAPAMKRGYSKLLICDMVIPPTGATMYQTLLDVNMMACLSACERTEAMWQKLMSEAGFKIVKMSRDNRGHEAVIEAELA
ncbi:putative O-methyltransferase [Hypomontagnella monticulosa]|nr:putative O-methyltransferase [Hypomontagnella monticulosa]